MTTSVENLHDRRRREIIKASALLGGLAAFQTAVAPAAAEELNTSRPAGSCVQLKDVPLASGAKVTIERRGFMVLIGINRPEIQNRIDPETYLLLAEALYQYDHDDTLRAAILFGHGQHFSRGIDVAAFAPIIASGRSFLPEGKSDVQDPLEKATPVRLSKPMIAVVHGDTWNMAHEIFLAADIRVAAADTRFGQDESRHGRFPGGGSTVRFVREAGWGNAMRYMLTGDHWSAAEAFRMGTVQIVSQSADEAMNSGVDLANRISACAPLGVKTTLESAHMAVVPNEMPVFSKMDAQFRRLFLTQDFKEGREADERGRSPVFKGY